MATLRKDKNPINIGDTVVFRIPTNSFSTTGKVIGFQGKRLIIKTDNSITMYIMASNCSKVDLEALNNALKDVKVG